MAKKLRIALDYDDTFTSDIGLFKSFVKRALFKKHEVKFVTIRGAIGNTDIETHAKEMGIEVVYCDGKQKSHCYKADIWLDDSPVMIPSYLDLQGIVSGCEVMGDLE